MEVEETKQVRSSIVVKYFRLSRGRPGFDSPLRSFLFPSQKMSCLLKKSLFSRELVTLGQLTRSFVVAGPYGSGRRISARFPTKPAYDPKFGWQISISPNKKVCVRKAVIESLCYS